MAYFPILFAIILPNIGGILGTLITKKALKPGGWFSKLKRPWYAPPNWVFGPMWTTLYICMGYASYLVWHDGGGFNGMAKLPLTIYVGQLLLNWLWTPIFFGFKNLGLSVVCILSIWCGVLSCIITFGEVNTTASYLMMPYIAWISLASAINIYIYRHN